MAADPTEELIAVITDHLVAVSGGDVRLRHDTDECSRCSDIWDRLYFRDRSPGRDVEPCCDGDPVGLHRLYHVARGFPV